MNLQKIFIKYLIIINDKKKNFKNNILYYNIENSYEIDKYFISTIFN